MEIEKRIDWWNIFFGLFFIYLVYTGFRIVEMNGGFPDSVSFWDTIIMALAAFRLTRLTVYDSITKWFRELFDDAENYTFRGTIRTLVNCPWCTGLWFALVVTVAYFTSTFLWFFIYVLALSGVATVMQLFANSIGWKAEHHKQKVLSRD